MKTIEERAREYYLEKSPNDKYQTYRERVIQGYVAGAEEQKKIDIEKACEWLKARNILTDASLDGFRKAMEE